MIANINVIYNTGIDASDLDDVKKKSDVEIIDQLIAEAVNN